MRYSKKRNIRKTKKKSKKGGSGTALRRGVQTLSRTAMRGPLRTNPDTVVKRAVNTLRGAQSLRENYNRLSRMQDRNRRAFYDPNFTIARVAQPIAPIQLKEQSNILNLQGIILKDYAEDCHGCVPVKKDELVKIILEYKTTDKIKVVRERDGRSGKVPRDYVKIIN